MIIVDSKDNFRCSVVPALDIEEASRAVLATRTEVYQFHFLVAIVLKYYVFWLQIAVDDSLFFKVHKTLNHLEDY